MDTDKVLSLLRAKGPLVPNDIKKVIGGDTILVGAILSELANRGFVKISNLKKGSSPFYYLEGQEKQLERFTEFLNPKDQKTVHYLKQKKILQDKTLDLFYRVSLRQIKDFAKPFTLQTTQGEQLFWRYYLVSETQAKAILTEANNPKPTEEHSLHQKAEKQKPIIKVSQQKFSQTELQQQVNSKQQQTISKPVQKAKPLAPEEKFEQQHIALNKPIEQTPFFETIRNYFKQSDIAVLEEKTITKNREYEFIIQVPTAVGHMEMLCVARNKKKLNQTDVAPALLKAKQKDLLCFFLTNGIFTKKSKELIKREYKGIIIKTF